MTAEDVEWANARFYEMRALGVNLRTHGSDKIGWYCDVIINGVVFCSELGDTQRDVIEKSIVAVIAARLRGLKIMNPQ